jgi:hypothetical protein
LACCWLPCWLAEECQSSSEYTEEGSAAGCALPQQSNAGAGMFVFSDPVASATQTRCSTHIEENTVGWQPTSDKHHVCSSRQPDGSSTARWRGQRQRRQPFRSVYGQVHGHITCRAHPGSLVTLPSSDAASSGISASSLAQRSRLLVLAADAAAAATCTPAAAPGPGAAGGPAVCAV